MDVIARAGFMGWPILGLSATAVVCGLAGIAVAMGARSRGAAVVLPGITVLLVILVGAAGVAGYAWGMRQMNAVLAAVDPSSRAAIEAVGRDEARQNLVLAAIGGALPLVLGLGGLALGATRKASGGAGAT